MRKSFPYERGERDGGIAKALEATPQTPGGASSPYTGEPWISFQIVKSHEGDF